MNIFLHKLTFKKIVILLGDNFAKVLIYHKSAIIEDIKIADISDKAQMKELAALLLKYQKLPIYIVLNVSEQSFEAISIPTSNPFLFSKLISRKVAPKKGGENVIKGYYKVSNNNGKKKSTDCILVKIPTVSPLKEWLSFLDNMPNIIRAIYSFPVELQAIECDIVKFLAEQESGINPDSKVVKKTKVNFKVKDKVPQEEKDASKWTFYVFQSETSGIRFTIIKDGDLVFTRLLHYSFEEGPFIEERVEVIKNEMIGTIEYLKRLDFKEQDGINIYLFVDNKFNAFFQKFDLPNYNFVYINLQLFGELKFRDHKNLDYDAEPDKLFINYFVSSGLYNGFITPKLKSASSLLDNNIIATVCLASMLVITAALAVLPLYRISLMKDSIKFNVADKNRYAGQLETIREKKFGFDIDEDKVIDVAFLHKKLMNDAQDPIKMIFEFYNFLPSNIIMSDIDWEVYKETQMKLVISAHFKSEGLSFEEVFSAYDAFLRSIKTGFPKYDIDHSELPDTISFESTVESLPINIQVVGPVR